MPCARLDTLSTSLDTCRTPLSNETYSIDPVRLCRTSCATTIRVAMPRGSMGICRNNAWTMVEAKVGRSGEIGEEWEWSLSQTLFSCIALALHVGREGMHHGPMHMAPAATIIKCTVNATLTAFYFTQSGNFVPALSNFLSRVDSRGKARG